MAKKPGELGKNAIEINELLIENFASLQKTMANLAVKFNSLSDNIAKLLNLFEMSARSFAEKPLPDTQKDKEFLDKINILLDQNKTIAKGLTLMEEKMRERVVGSQTSFQENYQQSQSSIPQNREIKKLPRI
ncbi:hypothetical protein FJZ19_04795 [Candidatus Pacearchaeota archaeon]|nr:hypothetical protein [Candidatus Pacearchaeota archaeon]